MRTLAERLVSGLEVQFGLELEQALAEAGRCFSCGTCTNCDNCFHYCPDLAIRRVEGGGYEVLTDYCKGCGMCVKECPTGSITMGKLTREKNLIDIMAAHQVPYAATATAAHLPDLVRKVEKAKAMRGFRIITILIPCIDGWGLPDDGGLKAARHAVESGAFPLYEVEDGVRYTINQPSCTRPVSDYLSLQRRYRGLSPERTAALQSELEAGWARLQRMAELGEATA